MEGLKRRPIKEERGDMKFFEVVEQASNLLQQKGRISYRALQREFALDDEALEDLKLELIEVEELAVDKDGKMLVWTGGERNGESGNRRNGESRKTTKDVSSQSLIPNTQPHAERRQ